MGYGGVGKVTPEFCREGGHRLEPLRPSRHDVSPGIGRISAHEKPGSRTRPERQHDGQGICLDDLLEPRALEALGLGDDAGKANAVERNPHLCRHSIPSSRIAVCPRRSFGTTSTVTPSPLSTWACSRSAWS